LVFFKNYRGGSEPAEAQNGISSVYSEVRNVGAVKSNSSILQALAEKYGIHAGYIFDIQGVLDVTGVLSEKWRGWRIAG
jgi:hypothetical protein